MDSDNGKRETGSGGVLSLNDLPNEKVRVHMDDALTRTLSALHLLGLASRLLPEHAQDAKRRLSQY